MSGVQYQSEFTGELQREVKASGPASTKPITTIQRFKETVKRFGDKPALHWKNVPTGIKQKDIPWEFYTYKEYFDQSLAFAKSLMSLEFEKNDRINIIGFNSKEWFVANMGAILAGGIPAGIYTTNLPDACKYIVNHSEALVIVCDGMKQLDKFMEISSEIPSVKAIVVYGDPVGQNLTCGGIPVYSFEAFLSLGQKIETNEIEERHGEVKPSNCATLIYTSGTTGPPKSVMISHDNITWTAETLLKLVDFDNNERIISYLPLSHIAAQLVDIHGTMAVGAKVYFAQRDALKGSLKDTMVDVKPTCFIGVPRVWEKMYEKMMEIGRSTSGIKKYLATWAKQKGSEKAVRTQYGGNHGTPCGFNVASAVVFRKIKAALGLSECKFAGSTAAPISTEILEYFASLNIHIYEVFGQSECTGPCSLCLPEKWKIGTVGPFLPGTEYKIDPNTGELCYRGRHIFMGYAKMEEETKETIDSEGWLHSGDIATVDEDGFLKITGRIKELIITAGGENIPPVLIEQGIKEVLPELSNCVLIGDKRKFLSALFTVRTEVDQNGEPTEVLTGDALRRSQELGSSARTVSEVMKCPLWKKYLDERLQEVNRATTSNAQKVQKYTLLPTDFSVSGGELTPTMKLKRRVVADKYSALIESMYQ